jgi:hypothetical protein
MRACTVGTGTSSALAISSVVRPPTTHSDSATRDSFDRIGWRVMKISASRSSSMASGSNSAAAERVDGPPPPDRRQPGAFLADPLVVLRQLVDPGDPADLDLRGLRVRHPPRPLDGLLLRGDLEDVEPLNSSFVSPYGPSETTGSSPVKSTTTLSTGSSPSAASSTPARMSSWLYASMVAMISSKSTSAPAANAASVGRMINMYVLMMDTLPHLERPDGPSRH